MIVTAEQMVQLSEAKRSQFEQLMIRHIRANFSREAQPVSDEKLLLAVRFAMELGERYGIVLQDDLRRFIEFLSTYGSQFSNRPQFASVVEVLARQDLDGTEKMDRVDRLEQYLIGVRE